MLAHLKNKTIMVDNDDLTGNSEGLSNVQKLWKEVKEWRSHWKWSKFLNALFLGLAISLFDSVTDFNFARSVPQDCRNTTNSSVKPFDKVYVSSPCGLLYYKNVERLTYTYIAYPGFFLTLDGLRSLVSGLVTKCTKGKEVNGMFTKLGSFFAVALEVSIAVGLLVTAMWSDRWEKHLPEEAVGYDIVIQGMSYLSFALVVGVKFLGLISHGPETYSLYHKATVNETIFESSLQLSLVSRIFFSSGYATQASLLSAVSSIVIIGKNGVQNFLQRHQEKLSEASLLGKICVATSVLPVFLLAAIFKLGAGANNEVWKKSTVAVVLLSSLALPILIILLLKMCNLFKDLPLTSLSEWILSELVSFHLWPKGRTGKRIGLTMTVFTFLLYASPGPFIIANPEPTLSTNYWVIERNNTDYTQWVSKTSDRLQHASISFLTIGFIAFVLAICLILFEDQWVSKIVFRFPKQPKQEEKASKGPPATEAEIESKKNTKLPREDHEGG